MEAGSELPTMDQQGSHHADNLKGDAGSISKMDSWVLVQRKLAVIVLTLIASLLAFQVACFFADILRILGISILISYLFINVVDFLEKYLRHRAVSVLLVYAALAVVVIVSAFFILPAMAFQVTQLIDSVLKELPNLIKSIASALEPLEARLHAAQINVRALDIVTALAANIPKPDPSVIVNRLSDVAMSTMTWLLYGVSIFVVSFYFLFEGYRLKDSVINHLPEKYRAALQMVAADIDDNLQAFFRGQVVLGILAGIVMLGVYFSLGVQYALLLSVFLAIWEVVPVIGPPIGFAPSVIAVAIHGMNFPGNRLIQVLALIVIFNVLQWIKDNVIAPRYIGNVIGLHPVVIFIAIMIGARLDGIIGIILALPVASVLNVWFNRLPLINSAAGVDLQAKAD